MRTTGLLAAIPILVLLALFLLQSDGLSAVSAAGPATSPDEPAPPATSAAPDVDPSHFEPEHNRALTGSWAAAPEPAPLDAEQEQAIQELESIGYMAGSVTAPAASNVRTHVPGKTWGDLNFVVSGHTRHAALMDMEGRVLHEWSYEYATLWPDADLPENPTNAHFWRRALLMPNGDVVAVHEGLGMLRLDKDSKLVWAVPNRAHHDLRLREDGSIVTLTRKARFIPALSEAFPILEDFVAVVDPKTGETVQEVSLLEAIENGDSELLRQDIRNYLRDPVIDPLIDVRGDVLHTNTVEPIDKRLANRIPGVEPGQVLIGSLRIGRVYAVDLDAGKVTWVMPGNYLPHHHPTVLDNGNVLLMINVVAPEQSAVVEVEPETGKRVWTYGSDSKRFFTEFCGTTYRLPNGNTLIVSSMAGQVLSVTPEKEIVWEYFNPERAGEHGELIASVFDLIRLPRSAVGDWLDRNG